MEKPAYAVFSLYLFKNENYEVRPINYQKARNRLMVVRNFNRRQ